MASIYLENLTVNYPVYGERARSLRNNIIQVATGGVLQRGVGCDYVRALDCVNFVCGDGDSIGLIGHNGSGKSTLLKVFAGIYPPTDGFIKIDGRVGSIFDLGGGLESELSGYENVINLSKLMGLSRKQIEKNLIEIENFTELGDFFKLPVRVYSSGMVMRLMFAMATSINPEILLLDEMITTGDASFQKKCFNKIEEIIAKSNILVFATHDIALIERYCNRYLWIEHGKVTEISISEVRKRKTL